MCLLRGTDWVFKHISGKVMLIRLQYLACFVVTFGSAMRCHAGAVTSLIAMLMGYGEKFGVLTAVL